MAENVDLNTEICLMFNEEDENVKNTGNFVDCLLTEHVCHVCEEIIPKSEEVVSCIGKCYRRFHRKCTSNRRPGGSYLCSVCQLGGKWCFLCTKNIEEGEARETCENAKCRNSFHAACIMNLSEKSNRRFLCSHHYCDTCAIFQRQSTDGVFLTCIRCPIAYHRRDKCIPAGTLMLNHRWIVCNEHGEKTINGKKIKTNVNFCFACGLGGTLLCCDFCPSAWHMDCTGLTTSPEGLFMCDSCEKGVKPMYGDIVWAKFGVHRWWPAQIVHPLNVPQNIERFLGEPGTFIVQFFGTRDYGPVTQRSVYRFQTEDDNDNKNYRRSEKEKDRRFLKAISEARQALLDKNFAQLNDTPSYVVINTNKYHQGVLPAYASDRTKLICSCSANEENPCGDVDCHNRSTLCECSSKLCLAGDRCQNQRFVRRQYAMFVKFLTIDRGFGLRLLQPVKKGDFVVEYCGEVINQEECNKRLHEPNVHADRAFYFLQLANDKIIDAARMGNEARFINHSCDANCETVRWLVNGVYRIGLFALRDIKAGEELTYHYNLDTLGTNLKTPCKCDAPNCSGFIGRIERKYIRKASDASNSSAKRRKTTTE